jgi:hypothetical protein
MPATATAARPRFTTLAPFSKPWWSTWRRRALAGETVGPMVAQAKRGRPWQVRADEAISEPHLVAVDVKSDAFRKWSVYFAMRGIVMPRPSRCPVAFLPSILPPETRS